MNFSQSKLYTLSVLLMKYGTQNEFWDDTCRLSH
eukprot:CAMPEP_0197498818 /NCGR_PEP_ID=MMETSP1311-20131121/60113_1 /TAXON_ID=464262 /ORGANISM="Genus nov. species nov., Strain RCC856" /LENGTH=33 /DNA_ID= /DNA_START= /DNA_END= /DNA_ORIENTATION=